MSSSEAELTLPCAGLAQGALIMPDVLRDPENPTQKWSSKAVKARLVDMACQEEYKREDVQMLSTANPAVAAAFLGDVASERMLFAGDDRGGESDEAGEESDDSQEASEV